MTRQTLRLTSPYMRGSDVFQAQTLLAAHGYSPDSIDGVFGQRTYSAVLSFQKATFANNPSEWDGVVGPRTWAALDDAPGDTQTPQTGIGRFIDYLKGEVANGSIYVWGAQGEKNITEAWIRKRETTAKNADRAVAFWKRQISLGFGDKLRAFDCSGLIMYYANREGLYKGDLSSQSLYAKSEKISRDDLIPGDLVFRHNGVIIYHVGAFIGGGMVIEAKGRDDGVVMRDINASGKSYWNRYGRLAIFKRQDNSND